MNNFSISTDELATGLQKAGATLSLMGNSLDESAALITSANATIQDKICPLTQWCVMFNLAQNGETLEEDNTVGKTQYFWDPVTITV